MASGSQRQKQPARHPPEKVCNRRERERDDVVAVGESGGEKDGEWRRERGGGGGVCRGGVCVVLGLVVGAMRVVSE